jgi:rare lipoprotein A
MIEGKFLKGFLIISAITISFLAGVVISWKIYESIDLIKEWEPKNESKPKFEILTEKVEEGIASWYGEPYHGKQAADGSIYDMTKMTVASKSLPLGSLVMIENLKNGRRVIATVTDRGPYVDGRIIDVSLAVAKALGMIQEGIAPVEVRKLRLIEIEPKSKLSNGD